MNLQQINEELKALNTAVRIEIHGRKLYLRAHLPPKPTSKRRDNHRQRIALGISANDSGFERAKAEAIKLGGLIACKEFDWDLYIDSYKLTCEQWCNRFERDYFDRREATAQAKTTYRTDYRQIFKKLPQERRLTVQVIKQTVLSIKPDTRQRKRSVVSLTQLAEFAGLKVDLKRYKGSYTSSKAKQHVLPEDEKLIEVAKSIPSAPWRNFILVLITYGLRPHEGFFLEFVDEGMLYVTDGKTGPRYVAPICPEWFDEFDLGNAVFPPGGVAIQKRDFHALGDRVTTQFRRYNIPFIAVAKKVKMLRISR